MSIPLLKFGGKIILADSERHWTSGVRGDVQKYGQMMKTVQD